LRSRESYLPALSKRWLESAAFRQSWLCAHSGGFCGSKRYGRRSQKPPVAYAAVSTQYSTPKWSWAIAPARIRRGTSIIYSLCCHARSSVRTSSNHPALPWKEPPAFIRELKQRPRRAASVLHLLILTSWTAPPVRGDRSISGADCLRTLHRSPVAIRRAQPGRWPGCIARWRAFFDAEHRANPPRFDTRRTIRPIAPIDPIAAVGFLLRARFASRSFRSHRVGESRPDTRD